MRISKIPTQGFFSLSLLFSPFCRHCFLVGGTIRYCLRASGTRLKVSVSSSGAFLFSTFFLGAPCLFSLGLPRPRTQWGKLRGLSDVTVLADVAVWTVRSAGLARHSSSRDTQGSEDCSDRFSCNFGQFSLVQYSAVYCKKGITM